LTEKGYAETDAEKTQKTPGIMSVLHTRRTQPSNRDG